MFVVIAIHHLDLAAFFRIEPKPSFRHQGMTLTELADLFLFFGAQYAINMDGGSSSVMVHSSKTILNQPTCYYNAIVPRDWVPCERSVSTVICLSS